MQSCLTYLYFVYIFQVFLLLFNHSFPSQLTKIIYKLIKMREASGGFGESNRYHSHSIPDVPVAVFDVWDGRGLDINVPVS